MDIESFDRTVLLSFRAPGGGEGEGRGRTRTGGDWAALWEYERAIVPGSSSLVAGIDEAGRGPLAGPVVAAAVVLGPEAFIRDLRDSKRLSPAARARVFGDILEHARDVAAVAVGPRLIDEWNIARATYEAMRRALTALRLAPDYLLVDGFRLPAVGVAQAAVVHGDSLAASIAAASVVAKVVRDSLMRRWDAVFPQYGFARHKGYGTREHLAAIEMHGPCVLHRMSFCGVCGGGQGPGRRGVDGDA